MDVGIDLLLIDKKLHVNNYLKTSLLLEQIAVDQKLDPEYTVAWLETENSLDPEDCKMFGIDMDRFTFIPQSDDLPAEECMDIIRALVSSGEYNAVVINSVAALSPKKEIEDELDKPQMALTARLLSKFLRVTTGQLAKNNCTLFLVNQVRANLNSMFGGNTTTGGFAIPFYATQRIEMKREKIMAGDSISEDEGIKVRCKVVKNRVAKGNPYKMCYYYALYGKGIDGVSELGTVLSREGILQKKGAWLRYEDESGDVMQVPSLNGDIDGKWNGNAKFVEFLREDSAALNFFENLLEEKLRGGLGGISLTDEEIEALREEEAKQDEANKEDEE